MAEHVGDKVKWLIENKFNGDKKEFAKALGLKEYNYLFKILRKETISIPMLKRIGKVLNMEVIDLLKEGVNDTLPVKRSHIQEVNEPQTQYTVESELVKGLRERVKDLEYIRDLLQDKVAKLESTIVAERARKGGEKVDQKIKEKAHK
jgi:hypothetical protein